MQRIIKICFTFLIFFYVVILIAYQYRLKFKQSLDQRMVEELSPDSWTLLLNVTEIFNKSDRKIKYIPSYDKFITADYNYCGGLGNQLYHIAVYYGIGRQLNRSPFLYSNKGCEIALMKNIKTLFPNIPKHVRMLAPKTTESKFVNPLKTCCDLSEFKNVKETYLIFKVHIPHFYQFFHNIRDEIRYLMEFDSNLKSNVSVLTKNFFKNDKAHKFCIHIRRGDLMNPNYRYQESKASFIIPASVYVQKFLRNQGHSEISLILLGQDQKFKRSLSLNATIFTQIYYPEFLNREQEFAFATLNCNTFLLSATTSTFAWWIAYLMPDGRNIFYNSQVYKKGDSSKYVFDKIFPPNWQKIDLKL